RRPLHGREAAGSPPARRSREWCRTARARDGRSSCGPRPPSARLSSARLPFSRLFSPAEAPLDQRVHGLDDGGRHLRRRTRGVDDDAALRLGTGDLEERLAPPAVNLQRLLLEAVGDLAAAAAGRAAQPLLRVEVEDE